MIEIIVGTDRQNSNSLKVANILLADYQAQKVPVGLIDLSRMDFKELAGANYKLPAGEFSLAVERVSRADGVVMVVPEYNGSFPGALKLFIDYWRYPETFENRPFAFVGLGTRWGGLRPVEHLQQVMGFRNAYVFPNRVFLSNIKTLLTSSDEKLNDGRIQDSLLDQLLRTQTLEFIRFVRALHDEGLTANARNKK